MSGQSDADTTDQERNRRFVIEHFDEFVNNRNLDAVIRNMSEDFYDHDGPGGKPTDVACHGDGTTGLPGAWDRACPVAGRVVMVACRGVVRQFGVVWWVVALVGFWRCR